MVLPITRRVKAIEVLEDVEEETYIFPTIGDKQPVAAGMRPGCDRNVTGT